jgi:ArsR family transcriptional regulator, arsenate/arsenite/antimonite-responsive transcriptional repressor
MEEKTAIKALAALAQEHRLKVFRLLVRHAPNGLPAGHIAAQVGVSASTMSAHLAHLERAGLLCSWREQRRILYAVETEGIRQLLTFLTEDCCGGRPELCGYGTSASMCQGHVFTVLFLCTGNSAWWRCQRLPTGASGAASAAAMASSH